LKNLSLNRLDNKYSKVDEIEYRLLNEIKRAIDVDNKNEGLYL